MKIITWTLPEECPLAARQDPFYEVAMVGVLSAT